MKIVLANKYFFLNGGTERYLSSLMEGLNRLGHEPVPFSIRYPGSWESPYGDHFLPPPGPSHFKDIRLSDLGPKGLLRYLDRSIYSLEARARLSTLLDATGGVDVGYVLNVYNYMSPSIIHTFKKRGIPVVVRLGDYNMVCPSYLFLREKKTCTLCLSGDYVHGLRHRCVKGSLAATALRVFSMYLHRWMGLYRLVDGFVVPCEFMRSKLAEAGYPAERIHRITTPVSGRIEAGETTKGSYILYFGRITSEKGLDTLIEAFQRLSTPGVELVLIGRSYDGERERLEGLVRPEWRERIRFFDFMDGEELSGWIGGALFSVVPSRWFDNAPISVYESFMHGTPVLAADIGGIPEQVEDGVTGRLFAADSLTGLAEGMDWMLSDPARLAGMGRAGRRTVAERCGMDLHIERLLVLFEGVRNNG